MSTGNWEYFGFISRAQFLKSSTRGTFALSPDIVTKLLGIFTKNRLKPGRWSFEVKLFELAQKFRNKRVLFIVKKLKFDLGIIFKYFDTLSVNNPRYF